MPEPTAKGSRAIKTEPTTPEAYAIPPPQPHLADTGSIYRELGALNEAVKTLKEQLKAEGEKLDTVRMDVTGAKAAAKVIWVAVALGASIVGGIVTEYFHHYVFGGSAK